MVRTASVLPYCESMGRPTKLDAKTQRRICDLLRKGVPRERSARLAGVHDATFHRWMADGAVQPSGIYHDFRAAVLRAEDELIERAMGAVVDAFEVDANGKYVHELRDRTAAWRATMPTRFPQDFSTRQEVRTTGADGGPVKVEAQVQVRPLLTDDQLASMTPEQLAAALAALRG